MTYYKNCLHIWSHSPKAVKVRSWRIRHVDTNNLSMMRDDVNVGCVNVVDGTIVGNIYLFSRYTESLSEPTCSFLTDT